MAIADSILKVDGVLLQFLRQLLNDLHFNTDFKTEAANPESLVYQVQNLKTTERSWQHLVKITEREAFIEAASVAI